MKIKAKLFWGLLCFFIGAGFFFHVFFYDDGFLNNEGYKIEFWVGVTFFAISTFILIIVKTKKDELPAKNEENEADSELKDSNLKKVESKPKVPEKKRLVVEPVGKKRFTHEYQKEVSPALILVKWFLIASFATVMVFVWYFYT